MHTKKDWIATKLAENSDVNYIKPYMGLELPNGYEFSDLEDVHIVLPSVLEDMKREEKVLSLTTIEDKEYVFFDFQMLAQYNVIIVDDEGLKSLRENWDGNIFSIFVKSSNQKPSKRVGTIFAEHDFDMVFNVDLDDIDELEARLSWMENLDQ